MADKDTLWTAVKAAYDDDGLITLTNIRDTSLDVVNDTVGTAAADQVISLWPLYAESVFDVTDSQHLAVALPAVIAVLWDRGGTAATIAREEWKKIFEDEEGLMSRLRRTEARARIAPATNAPTTVDGQEVRPYSHRMSMPPGYLPSRRSVYWDD